jgi:hypothetical protein
LRLDTPWWEEDAELPVPSQPGEDDLAI